MARRFVAMVAVALALLFIWKAFEAYETQNYLKGLVDAENNWKEKDLEIAMADTYGGKTPEETLGLYVAALEKGDYELASKYFIQGNQEKEVKKLEDLSDSLSIERYLISAKKMLVATGEYSKDGVGYTIKDPFYAGLRKYPNGIWKIVEI